MKLKIFISWSGERSKSVAKALKDWLPIVVQYVDPWMSDRDIKSGERWFLEISKQLEDAQFGIICLTPENIEKPWILFEAGALAKHLDFSRVVPLLLDLKTYELQECPFGQFQAQKIDREGIEKLIISIQSFAAMNITDDAPKDEHVLKAFEKQWPDLKAMMKDAPLATSQKKPSRNIEDILEDLISSTRNMHTLIKENMGKSQAGLRFNFKSPYQYNLHAERLANRGIPLEILGYQDFLDLATVFKDRDDDLFSSFMTATVATEYGNIREVCDICLKIIEVISASMLQAGWLRKVRLDPFMADHIKTQLRGFLKYIRYLLEEDLNSEANRGDQNSDSVE
jgi:hypothetical protein